MAPKSSVPLDQWRGLGMLLVLVSHGFYASDRVNGIGRIGIQLFFVISGVLVHRSLARRPDRPPVLLAVDFWWRRFRRLYPALLAYVVLMVPVTILFERAAPPAYALEPARYLSTVPPALVYAIDYWPPDPPKSLGHLWSVACEMQFFLVAPLIFFLGNRFVWGTLLAGLMVAGILAPVLDPAGADKYHFEYAAWPLMLGFCCEHGRERLRGVPPRVTRIAFACSLILFALGVLLPLLGPQTKTSAIACGSCAVGACVIAYVRGLEIKGAAGRSLTWLGQRTYSTYLWQQPFTICAYLPAMLHPPGAALSILVGAVCFHIFERPFLTRGRRRVIAGSPALALVVVAAIVAIPAAGAAPRDVIVFTRGEQLFAIRSDGSGLRRLAANERAPTLSPDGRFVAAASGGGIVVRARTGRLVSRIRVPVEFEPTDLAWSPGGRWIAFLAERCQSDDGRDVGPLCADLWLARPTGRVLRRLVAANVSTSDVVQQYAWSPGGRAIVFERYTPGGLAVVDVATGVVRAVPGTRRVGSRNPAWSSSGRIAFARQRGAFRGSDLYVVRADGRGLRKVCRAENAERPVYSRTGRLAFLDSRPSAGSNRWLVRVVGGDGRCRTVGSATEEWTLRWSPDGEWLLWENFWARLVIGRADGDGRPRALTRGSTADWG